MNRPQLKPPRLLPVVIFAGLALLAFKGVGLFTNGGYVLTGTVAAQASGGGGESGGEAAPAAGAAPHAEPTMTDSSPTLTDAAPTLATRPEAPAHGGAGEATGEQGPAGKHGNGGETAGQPGAAAAGHGEAAVAVAGVATPEAKPAEMAGPAPDGPAAATVPACATAPAPGSGPPVPGSNCDAVPLTVDSAGQKMPLVAAGGASLTEQNLLERLGQRRAELDKREADLNMRQAIVEAAEKQMQDRADALKALEARISQLDGEKKSMEDAQFAGLVKMYEAMKPQEAAGIFDGLDMGVLRRVAQAMDPRKMSPILARMAAARAQELTTQLAGAGTPPAAPLTTAAAGPAGLPQIVGH